MSDLLDGELDLLFRLPPAQMVEARDALAVRLRKAGDKSAAARVKALKRPTPSAWALNQVHFHTPSLLMEALGRADEVRALHAQDGVTPHALRLAHEAQRAASHALVEAMVARCDEAGLPGGPAQLRKATATVRALLAGLGDEPPGRMTHDLEPPGFEALGVLGEPSARASTPAPARPALSLVKKDEHAAERRRLQNEHEAEQARVREARSRLSRRGARAEAAERELAAAAQKVAELVRELELARHAERARREALEQAQHEHSLAKQELDHAEASVQRLEQQLATMTPPP